MVEGGQFFVFDVLAQDLKTLTTARFNQRTEQQLLRQALFAVDALVKIGLKFVDIFIAAFTSQDHTALHHSIVHHLEMAHLFAGECGHFIDEFGFLRISYDQADRLRCSLLLTICVIR